MRNRPFTGLGLGVTAAAIALAGAPVAAASTPAPITHLQTAPEAVRLPAADTCYDQTSGDAGSTWISSKFGHHDTQDNQGADDFTLTKRCVVTSVVAGGAFPGDPATSVNVVFYKDNGGVPGKVVRHGNQKRNTFTWSGQGTLDITLGSRLTLKPGTYWVSVQPNVIDGNNDWLWGTVGTQTGGPAMWRNPKGGFGFGCQTYTPLTQCAVFPTGPDDNFAILSS